MRLPTRASIGHDLGMGSRAQQRSARVAAIAVVLALAGCGGSDGADGERPSIAAWTTTWDERQASVPPREDLLRDDAADLCGRLVGEFREQMPALTPTPTEAMQPAVDDWVHHAETIVFECPNDPDVIDASYAELGVLAAEVDAALDASR